MLVNNGTIMVNQGGIVVDLSWHIIWKCALVVASGVLMLRFSGRRSISQMTAATTVIMISIGNLLASGVTEKVVWRSTVTVGLFLLYLVAMELMEYKFPAVEKFVAGRPINVVQDGRILEHNLRKLRISLSQFEMRLRLQGIDRASDLKSAMIEINGRLGYELMPHAKPVTAAQFEQLVERLERAIPAIREHNEGGRSGPES